MLFTICNDELGYRVGKNYTEFLKRCNIDYKEYENVIEKDEISDYPKEFKLEDDDLEDLEIKYLLVMDIKNIDEVVKLLTILRNEVEWTATLEFGCTYTYIINGKKEKIINIYDNSFTR